MQTEHSISHSVQDDISIKWKSLEEAVRKLWHTDHWKPISSIFDKHSSQLEILELPLLPPLLPELDPPFFGAMVIWSSFLALLESFCSSFSTSRSMKMTQNLANAFKTFQCQRPPLWTLLPSTSLSHEKPLQGSRGILAGKRRLPNNPILPHQKKSSWNRLVVVDAKGGGAIQNPTTS